MSIGALAVWFGVLELAFVLLVAGVLPVPLFVAWGVAACGGMIVAGLRS